MTAFDFVRLAEIDVAVAVIALFSALTFAKLADRVDDATRIMAIARTRVADSALDAVSVRLRFLMLVSEAEDDRVPVTL